MICFADVTTDAWYYEAVQKAANAHLYERLAANDIDADFRAEVWTKLETAPDWAAIEQAWRQENN